jgi:hypothetical protein
MTLEFKEGIKYIKLMRSISLMIGECEITQLPSLQYLNPSPHPPWSQLGLKLIFKFPSPI